MKNVTLLAGLALSVISLSLVGCAADASEADAA
jgi:hypothetical protein